MPSASLLSTSNMNNLVRDTFQANGLIRSHQQLQASSQTSLQKISSSSPKFMYANNNQPNPQQQQTQQHMQFPPPPPMVPLIQQVPKNEANKMNNYNSMIVPQLQQHSQQAPNVNNTVLMPNANGFGGNNHTQSSILMNSIINHKNNTQNQQQFQPPMHHQIQQQYQPLQQSQQSLFQTPSQSQMPPPPQQQQPVQQQLPQLQPTPCPSVSQPISGSQQVPMTTIMIPATAAAQLQSASTQIQQAALQANATNPNQPQILVFMIPYMVNQTPTLPVTPEQSSVNSTLARQPHNQSLTHQSQINLSVPIHNQQMQHQNQQQQQTQSQSQSQSHARTLSSLSNAKQDQEKFYVRANFSYQLRGKSDLSFQKGDILHVIDTLQNNEFGVNNWLATRVKVNGKDAEKGLIPNKRRAEEIAMEQRTLDSSEHNGHLDGGSSGVLSASVGRVNFLKRRAAQRSKSLCKDNWDNVVFDIGSFKLPPYERVVSKHPGLSRPVVIFGPLSDLAREKLIRDYPERFAYPTGFENHAPDHPKVIRLKGVFDVINLGKHALLDITPSAVEKLNNSNVPPIVIFMKTDSKSIIKEFRSRAAKSLDPNARDEDTLKKDGGKLTRKLLEQSMKLEKTYYHIFTSVLDLSTMGSEMWYRKLRETIENQQSANVWLTEKWPDKKHRNINDDAACSSSINVPENAELWPFVDPDRSSHVDDSSALNERFNESLNIGNNTVKSTIDLLPDGTYGNRSQLRNAYAHSLAQKLARASSEPKLNGTLSDHDDEDDEDDDDDDDIIKKPFPAELENTSSISSSNGATSYGQSSMSGSNMTYQHYPPPQIKHDQGSSRMQQQESLYSRNPMINQTYSNGVASGSNYHSMPPMANDAGYHNQSMNNISSNVIDLAQNRDTRGSAFQVYSDMNQNNYHYYNLNKI